PGGLENGAFHRFLSPVVSTATAGTGGHRGGHLLPYVLMAVATGIGLAGWFTAHYFYYVKPEQPELLANRLKGAYALLLNKYWVDELYDRLAVEPSKGAGRLLDRIDAVVVDRAVVAVEQVTDLNAAGSTWFEKYVIYGLIRKSAMAVAGLELFIAVLLMGNFTPNSAQIQFAERTSWIPAIGVGYHLGVDGISVLFIPLTAFLTVLIMVYSWDTERHLLKPYLMSLLGLEGTMVGVFASLDLILFFVFWELMLLPSYFLIKLWGPGAQRHCGGLEDILYTL